MNYTPTVRDIQDLIKDYARDFGETLPFDDAERMLVLYEELCALFERRTPPPPPDLMLD